MDTDQPSATTADRHAQQTSLDGLRRQATDAAQQAFDQARDNLKDTADRATDYAADVVEQGRRALAQSGRELNDRIEANPVTAVILAAFAGFVIGVATRSRRRW